MTSAKETPVVSLAAFALFAAEAACPEEGDPEDEPSENALFFLSCIAGALVGVDAEDAALLPIFQALIPLILYAEQRGWLDAAILEEEIEDMRGALENMCQP